MKTVSIFKNGHNQAIRLPKEMEFERGVTELEIVRNGDEVILRPVRTRPSWSTLPAAGTADDDFLMDREDVVTEGRF